MKTIILLLTLILIVGCNNKKENTPNFQTSIDALAIFTDTSTSSGDYGIVSNPTTNMFTFRNDGDSSGAANPSLSNSDFSLILQSGCSSVIVGATCSVRINFNPLGKALGIYTTELSVGGVTKTLTATVESPASGNGLVEATISGVQVVAPLDYGTFTGAQSSTKVIRLTNTSSSSIGPISATLSDSDFSFLLNSCTNKILAPNNYCDVRIRFSASGKASRVYESNLIFGSFSLSLQATVSSGGTSSPPSASIAFYEGLNLISPPLDYGAVSTSGGLTKIITIKNTGTSPTSTLTATISPPFKFILNSCSNKNLAPNGTCTVRVNLSITGQTAGPKTGTLSFGDSSLSLTGEIVTTSNPPSGGLVSSLLGVTYGSNVFFYNHLTSKLSLWGNNSSYGNVGNNSGIDELSPVVISNTGLLSGKTIKEFSMYNSHACSLTTDNNIYCWGYNYGGQIGDGSTNTAYTPTAVNMSPFLGKTIRTISTGEYFTCAVTTDDLIYCWGANGVGQSGSVDPLTSQEVLIPTTVNQSGVLSGKGIKEIKTAYTHTCVIASDDRVYCWGGSGDLLGDGTGLPSHVPVAVDWSGVLAGKTAKKIEMTYSNVCIIASDDRVYCWGSSYYGQLGNNDPLMTYSSAPVAVNWTGALAGKSAKSLALSDSNVCLITTDDLPYCWGSGNSGTVGNGSSDYAVYEPSPVDMSGALLGKTIKSLHLAKLSGTTICAIASDDKLYCWGNNYSGQLANGSTGIHSNTPVATSSFGLLSSLTIKMASVEGNNTCVQASDNQVYCIGPNYYGQVGNGTTNDSPEFVLAPTF